jgi:hypothetical protein
MFRTFFVYLLKGGTCKKCRTKSTGKAITSTRKYGGARVHVLNYEAIWPLNYSGLTDCMTFLELLRLTLLSLTLWTWWVLSGPRCLYNKVGFQWLCYVSCYFRAWKISSPLGALQSPNCKNHVKNENSCYMAVFSNSPIDDNIFKDIWLWDHFCCTIWIFSLFSIVVKALSNEMAANPSIFFESLPIFTATCNHRSDGIFQILSRNLLAISSDEAQLIFTPSSSLPELASYV